MDFDDEAQEAVDRQINDLHALVEPRCFTAKQMGKLGCVVELEKDGTLIISRGISRPPAASKASAAATPPTAGELPPSKPAAKSGAIAEPDVSQALIHRLSVQLTIGTETALIQDADLATSVLLATIATRGYCEGLKASVSGLGRAKLDLLGGNSFPANLELARALKPADRAALLVLVAGAALDFQAHTTSQNLIRAIPD